MASTKGILSKLGFANQRIWVKLVSSIGGVLIVAMGVMIVYNVNVQRELALRQARDLAMTTHHITMANLLFMKVTKTIKRRALYYDQVRSTKAIKDLRVLRGESVVYEMGDGDAISMTHDALEKQVLKTGKAVFLDTHEPKYGHVLRAIIPAVASKNYLGKNCMECHEEAKVGDVMGAVSMRISLDDLDASIQSSRISLLLGTILITVPLLIFIYFFIRRVVTQPLSGMVTSLRNISSGEGDLTSRLPVNSQDEIGEASAAFNQMMDKLHALIVHVNAIAGRVIESSSQLNSQSDNVANGSETQADRSEAAAQSLEEMTTSIANVAESCSHVETLSQQSRERAVAGMDHLHHLEQSIQQVSKAVSAIVSQVENFVTRTASISTSNTLRFSITACCGAPMDSFELNKIMGAILATCLGLLTLNIAAGAIFAPGKLEKPGYAIAVPDQPAGGTETAKAEPAEPIAVRLASSDPGKGQAAAKQCAACHTFEKGKAQPGGVSENSICPIYRENGNCPSSVCFCNSGTWDAGV